MRVHEYELRHLAIGVRTQRSAACEAHMWSMAKTHKSEATINAKIVSILVVVNSQQECDYYYL